MLRSTRVPSSGLFYGVLTALLLISLVPVLPSTSYAADAPALEFIDEVVELEDGSVVVAHVAPLGPPDVRGVEASMPDVDLREAQSSLSGVPAFDWVYGCSPTSAAMLFGYYDSHGFPDIYTGPAGGGVCPLDNTTAWDPGESPLSATHEGYDDLSSRGHVDDYWEGYLSTGDPYNDGGWVEHDYADCTADYMGTSQWENWYNADGSTTFYFAEGNEPLYDFAACESYSPARRDGCRGMRLFAESRGYTVLENYNQYIAGHDGNSAGFTYEQFKDEIDAGRPVMIQVDGHTMLGVGYDGEDTVYVHDTWSHEPHAMTWGGTYGFEELQHFGVTVIRLAPTAGPPEVDTDYATSVEESTATLHGSIVYDGGSTCEYRFSYGMTSNTYDTSTDWTGSLATGDDFSESLTGLASGETYYFIAEARNMNGTSAGFERSFITKPCAPSDLTGAPAGTDTIEMAWTPGEGAQKTKLQRKAGGYPTGPSDGTTVHFDAGASATDTGLEPDTPYYYRAWSHVEGSDIWSDEYAEAQVATEPLPYVEVTTEAANLVMDSSAQLNGVLVEDGGEQCECRFEYDVAPGSPYGSSTPWVQGFNAEQPFEVLLESLDPGTTYFYRAQARNLSCNASGDERWFTTLPLPPVDLVSTPNPENPYYSLALSWIPGESASRTVIRGKQGSPPSDPTDGYAVYDGDGSECIDGNLSPGETYYYRAWSCTQDLEDRMVWSSEYSESQGTTESGSTVELELELEQGWNLVSVPLICSTMDVSSVFPGAAAVYTWNAQTKSYVAPLEIQAHSGYWVAMSTPATLLLEGLPVESWTKEMAAGWNMVGSVAGASPSIADPDDTPPDCVEGFAYGWNPAAKSYVLTDVLAQGSGYWMPSHRDCQLSVGAA